MDALIDSCAKFAEYPKNLVQPDALKYTLQSLYERLKSHSNWLFNENDAALDFLELHDGNRIPDSSMQPPAFEPTCVKDLRGLRLQLRNAFIDGHTDPRCRFVFIHALHSRDSLRISLSMLSFLFTYHQVMPSFLDFIFPFGRQVYARDSYFSGFKEGTRLSVQRNDASVPQLSRSGTGLRMCYNLRSVERKNDKTKLPWSIRQCALYHEFDVKTGRTLWIVVKGNKLMKKRITEAAKLASLSRLESRSEAFEASFVTHLLLCDWSAENWRWYINDLEDQLQALTRGFLMTPVDKDPKLITMPKAFHSKERVHPKRNGTFSLLSRTSTSNTSAAISFGPGRTTLVRDSRAPTLTVDQHGSNHFNFPYLKHGIWTKSIADENPNSTERVSPGMKLKNGFTSDYLPSWVRPRSLKTSATGMEKSDLPLFINKRMTPDELPPTHSERSNQELHEDITFSSLQGIQHLEEKIQEALLSLKLNAEVLGELRENYSRVTKHRDFPNELQRDCETEIDRFDSSIRGVQKDIFMLQSRTETLLQLLANRKSLLNGILQHRSAQGSEFLAREAQTSASSMEEIARKTKQETVSMRVITSVTLFFLPATFIAVTMAFILFLSPADVEQTFMSTDILKYEEGELDFQKKGLSMYLSLAVPLTIVTFIAWYLIYLLTKRKEHTKKQSGIHEVAHSNMV